MDGTLIAVALVAVIDIILIFTILKICQHLDDISHKLDSVLRKMDKENK